MIDLPYGRQSIDESDIAAVVGVLRSDFLTSGPEIAAFETAFAAAVDAPFAVACNSATAALHLALDALGVGPGDGCIVPAITFLATANAALYCGADVVFADVDPDTGLMTPDTLAEAVARAGPAARAVLPVHLAGAMCDMRALSPIAREAGLAIVEDSCHALASLDGQGRPAGACDLSDAATFSFHPVKTLACGEGGMVTTRSAALADHMRRARSHGVERSPERFQRGEGAHEPWWYEMVQPGWNYRMPDINAALGRSQLMRLAHFAARRRALAARYADALEGLAPLVLTPAEPPGDPCRHLYNVRIDFQAAGVTRAQVMARLKAEGIGAQVHYIPLYRQPFHAPRHTAGPLPGAEAHYARTLSLPLWPGMADGDPERVAQALERTLGL
ncbi:MAG: UDP-4-amino-4,6-dideoxy-N-acetyl-beta-L-altrosamine transaminase [Alphaproteobacteria bacterium]|nr:UDP-4-amino-4,6-dideoxy-N-acetyl-beta-L-altrosamine transaminase [Alphaproteobacteria bacterium]